MTTHAQVQAKNIIARLKDREQYGSIGLCTAVWLNVGIFATEHLFDAVNGELF